MTAQCPGSGVVECERVSGDPDHEAEVDSHSGGGEVDTSTGSSAVRPPASVLALSVVCVCVCTGVCDCQSQDLAPVVLSMRKTARLLVVRRRVRPGGDGGER